ncbi:hypothetical protein GCM10017600_52720 [Streptosporangium carneum]|uniref:Uncharacterized protein n=1 Tax=Streptosporangium carneum TaxID=47481 RepID=A0A9W6I619_9ACTN|nr:hypothetical protein GCM10017600_52720 [Streptosporangium carneum]
METPAPEGIRRAEPSRRSPARRAAAPRSPAGGSASPSKSDCANIIGFATVTAMKRAAVTTTPESVPAR